jgi:hypothetical protein
MPRGRYVKGVSEGCLADSRSKKVVWAFDVAATRISGRVNDFETTCFSNLL